MPPGEVALVGCQHEFYWYAAMNEEGWRCCTCKHKPGEPPGFSPALDRSLIAIKVMCLLNDLSNANLVYVSNGTGGDELAEDVARQCQAREIYDQRSILGFLLSRMTHGHAKYWKEVSDGVVAGKDPRRRCACGKLARVYQGEKAWCSDCHRAEPRPSR